MPIPISCDYCDVSYRITDAAAGKRIRCKDCGEPIDVPKPRRAQADRAQPGPAARKPAGRSRSAAPPSDKRGAYIAQRRERKRGGRAAAESGRGTNILIAAAVGVVTVAGAIGFLVFGRGGDDAGTLPDTGAVVAEANAAGGAREWAERMGNRTPPPAAGQASAARGSGVAARFKTKLTRRGPAPQEADPVPPRADVRQVRYESDGQRLKAWVMEPRGRGPFPALLYLHGGFAFGMSDLEVCQPFVDEGFIVMAPAVRGENGNPGHFELFVGEVDDAVAAANWLAQQPNVDRNSIYAFGHSVGGGLSALLSLRADAPIVHCGSAGGLYGTEVFPAWADIAPFNTSDAQETRNRVLAGREASMVRDHYGYFGSTDLGIAMFAQRMNGASPRLHVVQIPGDHHASLPGAIARYLQVAKRDLQSRGGTQRPPSSSGVGGSNYAQNARTSPATTAANIATPPPTNPFRPKQPAAGQQATVKTQDTAPPAENPFVRKSSPNTDTAAASDTAATAPPTNPFRKKGTPTPPATDTAAAGTAAAGTATAGTATAGTATAGTSTAGTATAGGAANPAASGPGARRGIGGVPPGAGRPSLGGRLPSGADSDEDYRVLVQALDDASRVTRHRAIQALARSKRPEVAGVLGARLKGPDRSSVVNALAGMGAAGEAELLKAIDPQNDGVQALREMLFALVRCGTEKSLPTVDALQNHNDRSISTFAQHVGRVVRSKSGRNR